MDIVHRVGRRELWRTLKTADPVLARRRALLATGTTFSIWQRVRSDVSLTKAQIDQLVVDHFDATLRADELSRISDHSTDPRAAHLLLPALREVLSLRGVAKMDADKLIQQSGENPWHFGQDEAHRIAHACMGIALQTNDWREGKLFADAVLEGRGLGLEVDGPEYRLLCLGLLRAVLEATGIMIRRSEGDWTATSLDPLFGAARPITSVASPPISTPTTPNAPPLSLLVEKLLAGKMGITAKFKGDYRAAIAAFEQTLAKPDQSTEATRRDVANFKDLLLQAPANWTKHYRGKPLPEVVLLAASDTRPRLAARTVNDKYLALLSTVMKWTVNNGYAETNAAQGVRADAGRKGNRRDARDPFKIDQLQKIFGAPVFTGCLNDRNFARPGCYRIRDHRFWAPLVGLFSGARLNEIGQLRRQDFVVIDGVWCFQITDEGEEGRHRSCPGTWCRSRG